MTRSPVSKLLLFGATGDLAKRMLLPSLFNLHADGLLPDDLQIIGSAAGDPADKVGDISGGLAIYRSTAPSLFESAVEGLQKVNLTGDTVRIALEKPLGYD